VDDNYWNQVQRLDVGVSDPVDQLHETSKIGPYDDFPSQEAIVRRMLRMYESLEYQGYPAVTLPTTYSQPKLGLLESITTRESARAMKPVELQLADVATLLHHAYGINRDNKGTHFPRPFRNVPSGGALYPLEIYFHCKHVNGLPTGLYHYNPSANEVRRLLDGDQTLRIAEGLVEFQRHFAHDASLVLFITALIPRSTFKYSARGYRFLLLEAGHVAQNLDLVSTGLGLAVLNIGGYYDRRVDEFLGVDGYAHSTIYMAAVGSRVPDPVPGDGA
jgi:SagB-type dehydrogenase family enzyme